MPLCLYFENEIQKFDKRKTAQAARLGFDGTREDSVLDRSAASSAFMGTCLASLHGLLPRTLAKLLMTVEEIRVHPCLAGIHYPTNMHVLLWQACGSTAIITTSSKIHRTFWGSEGLSLGVDVYSRAKSRRLAERSTLGNRRASQLAVLLNLVRSLIRPCSGLMHIDR